MQRWLVSLLLTSCLVVMFSSSVKTHRDLLLQVVHNLVKFGRVVLQDL
jgi:hypothetical protein